MSSLTSNKLQRKLKGQSRKDNPETMGTQDTGRRQTKLKRKIKKTEKNKEMSNTDPQKNWE
jgi:hypothetical protein